MDLKDYDTLLSETENRLDRLRALYEQYFQGIERLEPTIPRKDLERRIATLRKALPRNTALRFRFQRLVQKYTTYQTYWKRITRQIEEGTYRRDVIRARNLKRRLGGAGGRPESIEIDLDAATAELAAVSLSSSVAPEPHDTLPAPSPSAAPVVAAATFGRPVEPTATKDAVVAPIRRPVIDSSPLAHDGSPPAAGRRAPGAPPVPPVARGPVRVSPPPVPRSRSSRSVDESHIRQVYDRYVEARRQNNERVDNLQYEKVARSIRAMLPKLEQKHRGKRIEFEVVVKNGRVGLKPVTRG